MPLARTVAVLITYDLGGSPDADTVPEPAAVTGVSVTMIRRHRRRRPLRRSRR
jgi:hypothetical protein